MPLSKSLSSSILTRFFFRLESSSSRCRFLSGSIIFSVGGGPGGIGGSTFSGGGGPGGGCGIFEGEPGAFLLVGEVGVDIAAMRAAAASQCNRFVECSRVVSLAELAEPMMLCVEVLFGTTAVSKRAE